jgi:DeoR/GlpR family transcriptional regulator of sugar metabolism
MACSERRIAICSADTLGRHAFVRFGDLTDIHQIVVAGQPDDEVVRAIAGKGVAVVIVPVPDGHPGRTAAVGRMRVGSLG